MKLKIIFMLLLLFILSLFIFICIQNDYFKNKILRYDEFNSNFQKQVTINDEIPTVKFPFKNCYDENRKKLNIIMISAPFRTIEDEQAYENYKKQGLYFCGISSYMNFPDKILNPHEDLFHIKRNHNYINMVTAWLHCFKIVPPILANSGLPMDLITEADLKDTDGYYKPNHEINKEYDFMYVCLDEEGDNSKCIYGWQSYNRNWDLAKLCLTVMCRDFNLKGIIVGRTNCEFTNHCSGIVKTIPLMDFHTFQKEMQKCRILFVPNVSDASPRIMTEAMCYNIPVLTNYNIIGGWHNVISGVTGEFFTDENDIIQPLTKIIQNYDNYNAREWYCANRGRNNYGKKLAIFLKQNYPNLNNPNIEIADI